MAADPCAPAAVPFCELLLPIAPELPLVVVEGVVVCPAVPLTPPLVALLWPLRLPLFVELVPLCPLVAFGVLAVPDCPVAVPDCSGSGAGWVLLGAAEPVWSVVPAGFWLGVAELFAVLPC